MMKMNSQKLVPFALTLVVTFILLSCSLTTQLAPSAPPATPTVTQPVDRLSKISSSAVKMTPQTDAQPPQLYSTDFQPPIPVPGLVNTAGGEDSPFITPAGDTLYFFFTPDVSIPVEKQLLDGVTGIYVSKLVNGQWSQAKRILLQDPGKLAMDGCEFVQEDVMWFCSTREGYTGIHWFTAGYLQGEWQNWQLSDFNPDYQVGELHISQDGLELYFASAMPSRMGGLDLWMSKRIDGKWQTPINLAAVNTPESEGWPALSPDGSELWLTRNFGLWRSKKVDGEWQTPELILSPLAGEASLDNAGNLYFVHHFYRDGQMVEADIYVAYKK